MKQIAIITGGNSSEYEISIDSANTVFNNLDKNIYNPLIINIQNDSWTAKIEGEIIDVNKENFSIIINSEERIFDYVFMALHGDPAENGNIQEYFDNLKIPYSSCDSKISSLTFNKYECNRRLINLGFNCAKSLILDKNEEYDIKEILDNLKLPLFIKPNQSGSSLGISKVSHEKDIVNAMQYAFSHDTSIIIEEFINGNEFSCGVMNNRYKATALPVTEIISHNEFFDFEAKYKGLSEEITPARINKELYQKIQKTSEDIFRKMNLRGVCRIDFIVKEYELFIIEINTIPGLSEESIIPKQVAEYKMSLIDFFSSWIEGTLNK